ncbi:hypothetical protein GBBBJNDB_00345 [Pseudomonas phage Callisto]|nr:hypothetical protein GBBBJNDB_00345 [Pseudomonas phage Callisto]
MKLHKMNGNVFIRFEVDTSSDNFVEKVYEEIMQLPAKLYFEKIERRTWFCSFYTGYDELVEFVNEIKDRVSSEGVFFDRPLQLTLINSGGVEVNISDIEPDLHYLFDNDITTTKLISMEGSCNMVDLLMCEWVPISIRTSIAKAFTDKFL